MARKQSKADASVFDRAAEAVENGTAERCAELIDELQKLEQRERAELAEIRPPGRKFTDGFGTTGTLKTGRRYAEAAAADDRDKLAQLRDDYDRLSSRVESAKKLRTQLEKRRKKAEDEERRAAAPQRAREIVDQLDDLLDEHEAAIAAFNEAHERLRERFSDLIEQRKLDPSAATVSVEQFHRVGSALAHLPPRRRQVEETYGNSQPPQIIEPLFGDESAAVGHAKMLIDPPSSLVSRLRKLLSGKSTFADSHSDAPGDDALTDRLTEWRRELVRLLGRGKLDEAKRLGPPTAQSRGRQSFERLDGAA